MTFYLYGKGTKVDDLHKHASKVISTLENMRIAGNIVNVAYDPDRGENIAKIAHTSKISEKHRRQLEDAYRPLKFDYGENDDTRTRILSDNTLKEDNQSPQLIDSSSYIAFMRLAKKSNWGPNTNAQLEAANAYIRSFTKKTKAHLIVDDKVEPELIEDEKSAYTLFGKILKADITYHPFKGDNSIEQYNFIKSHATKPLTVVASMNQTFCAQLPPFLGHIEWSENATTVAVPVGGVTLVDRVNQCLYYSFK